LAGPGTGKTATIVAAAAARIEAGTDPESILALTFGRRAAAELRVRIAALVGRTIREPLARTFHSYAYGLLRRVAALRGDPPPRLLSGPEQDLLIRELLAGHAEGVGEVRWPAELAQAVRTRGFAAELRDLLLRALERDISPADLAALGRRRGREDWVAAAAFLGEYRDVTALRGGTGPAGDGLALDPAELIRAAVDVLRSDPDLLAAERGRLNQVYVDEYQDCDPAQDELLALLAGDGRDLVVVGDPDQSIYAFRGASRRAILDFPDRFRCADGTPAPTVALTVSRRGGAHLLAASRRVIAHTSGPRWEAHRSLRAAADGPGAVEVHVLVSSSQEASFLAHRLREAHLREGIAWSQMAVLVRSTARQLAVLRRAFVGAGVPVAVTGDELPLAEQPAAVALLDLLEAALPPDGGAEGSAWSPAFDEELAVALPSSPLGGADTLDLRRLRVQLRRIAAAAGDAGPSGPLIVQALREPGDLLAVDESVAAPAHRIAGLLALARRTAARPGATVEDALWAIWEDSGLGPRWQRSTRHAHAAAAAAAHRDLDAVVALFDSAARFVDRLPRAGARSFLDHVRSQHIPADSLAARAPTGEAVRILTAHSAKGLEWDLVVVAGVQQGRWPDLRVRGSLLGSEELVDLADGIDPATVSAVSSLRDEEWRLFYVAVTRARRRLIVTAVDSPDGDVPSPLLDAVDERARSDGRRPHSELPRLLSLPALVAELRAAAADPAGLPATRDDAVVALRRLAEAGVPGADPDRWWGVLPLSDDGPLRGPDEPVRLSPSRVDRFATCGLRWLLESAGGSGGPGPSQSLGTLVHDVASYAVDGSVGLDALQERMDRSWDALDFGSSWYSRQQRDKARDMLERLHRWVSDNPRALVGTELDFDVRVGRATLRGRVDRLERDDQGRLVVVDLKTGSVPPAADMPTHPQLGVYQQAVEAGGFGSEALSGGAELLALKDVRRASVKAQPALADGPDPGWAAELIERVADGMAAATFVATENTQCRRCPVATSCPLVARGRQVTG
ncbi:MAG: ATP-dependent helicase, partial [Geodermatophilaceae bacterium]